MRNVKVHQNKKDNFENNVLKVVGAIGLLATGFFFIKMII